MPSVTIKQFSGLFIGSNPFSLVPEGALAVADEILATLPGELESRRGRKPSVQFTADRCFPVPVTGRLLTTARSGAQPMIYDPDTDTTITLIGSAATPLQYPYASDARVAVQAAAANGSLYYTTARGACVVPGLASYASAVQQTARFVGLPRPLPNVALATTSGVYQNTFTNNTRRTYRVTLAMYDALGNFYESEPSEPFYAENTSGSAKLGQVIFDMPPSMGLNLPITQTQGQLPIVFFRIWRALEVPAGTISSDEMFLVGNVIPSGASSLGLDANGFWLTNDGASGISFNDISVDALLTIPLYTNPRTGDGFGIAGGNARPPAAGAIAYFKQRMYYARTSFKQALQISIIGTGGGGVGDGDTITIDGITYTGVASTLPTVPIEANQLFGVYTAAGQVAQNLEATARSLTRAINFAYCRTPLGGSPRFGIASDRSPQYKLQAKYASLGGVDFGRIILERVLPAPLTDDPGVAFSAVTTSLGVSFPNGTNKSTDSYAPGGVAWSKINQPEAVPAINFQNVGDPQAICLGWSVHRDSLFLYKEDGVWLVKDDGGPQPTFSQLDPSVNVIAPSTIQVIDNQAYCLTARGPLQVSEQGTWPVGEAIRPEIVKLLNASPNKLANAYGIGHDSDRLYVLGLPAAAGEGACSIQYVLRVPDVNSMPRWTRWLLPSTTHGCVIPISNKMAITYGMRPVGNNVLGAPTGGVLVERRGGVVSTDYVDYVGSVACPAVASASKLVFASDVHLEIQRGDKFWYTAGGKAYEILVTAVAGSTVTLDGTYPFAGGTLTFMRAIQSRWRLLPITGGEPTAEKQWNYVQAYFEYFDADTLDVKLDSEGNPLAGFSTVWSDPKNTNQGGQIQGTFPRPVNGNPSPPTPCGQIQWLRNCRDVLMRCDPGRDESRSARLGVEMLFAQARCSFRLAAISAWVGEANETGEL